MSKRGSFVCFVLTGVLIALTAVQARGATVKQVDAALEHAVRFIYSKQHAGGDWEYASSRQPQGDVWSEYGGQWGGCTALCTYALLASGEDAQDPRIQKAVKWLKGADMIGVYAIGMRCQVWLLLPQTNETRSLARRDAELLEQGLGTAGKCTYLYPYTVTKRDPNAVDHSSSQFGVLGIWACAQCGIEIPDAYWRDVEKRWIYDQQSDGGWLYADKPNGTDHTGTQADMTAAGVATLYITQDYVHAAEGVACHGNLKNDHIDAGLKWIAGRTKDWFDQHSFGAPSFQYPGYTLYGIERIGVASGLKYFGDVNWYDFAADWCVHFQEADGAWTGGDNVPNTALTMLFLSRGRAPVVIDKVQYNNSTGPDKGQPGHWNERPRDVANFVRWMSRKTERDLNWQITNLDVPETELHDAPILYLSGNQPLSLTADEAEKLKQFALHGGMILLNSDCGSAGASNAFVTSVQKLAATMFPDYEFRQLPKDHPIFTNQQYPASTWKSKVILRGISNGVRELMILMPADPAKIWQMQETTGSGRLEAYQAVNDIVLYATDKQKLKVKGDSYVAQADPKITATQTVKVVRLKYAGNWDPEPGGWDQLSAVMHNRNQVDLSVKSAELGKAMLGGFKLAHLTGTGRLTLTDAQQQQLVKYVQNGGTLLIDAAGGSPEFADSAKPLLEKLFGTGDTLPPEDAVFKAATGKAAVHYRQYARAMLGSLKSPRLMKWTVNGKGTVYYSREDLSAGLVGEPVDGVIGYEPQSAIDIVSGIVLGAK